MATDRDGVAEGSDEAELVAVAVCALAHLHPLCPEWAPWASDCVLQRRWCQQETGEPQKSSRAHDPPVVPSSSPLLLRALSRPGSLKYRGWWCFMGSCLSRGRMLYKDPFLFFPSYSVRKARASLSILSLKCHVLCAIPSFPFGKERKAGLLCCNNSRPHSLRMPCVVLWSQTHF